MSPKKHPKRKHESNNNESSNNESNNNESSNNESSNNESSNNECCSCSSEECRDKECRGDTVIITFTSNVAQFPIVFSDFAGNVYPCQALLLPGNSLTDALQCLFKQGFEIVAFTSRSNPEVTYTLRRC